MIPLYRLTDAPGYHGAAFCVGPYHFSLPAFPMHRQDFGELVFVLDGTGVHRTARARYPIGAGDVFYIPPDEPHGFADAAGMSIVNIAFDSERALKIGRDVLQLEGYHALFRLQPAMRTEGGYRNRLRLEAENMGYVRALLRRIDEEYRVRAEAYESMLWALLTELIVYVARVFSGVAAAEDRRLWRLARVAAHLETAYGERLRLDDLARSAGVSRNTLLRSFGTYYGVSPMQYLLAVRIREAQRLLRDTELSVTEVASRCGFSDGNYFCRRFAQRVGVSPGRYRRGG